MYAVFLGRPNLSYPYSCIEKRGQVRQNKFRGGQTGLPSHTYWSGSCATAQTLLTKWYFPFWLANVPGASNSSGLRPQREMGSVGRDGCQIRTLNSQVMYVNIICELQRTLQIVMSQPFQM